MAALMALTKNIVWCDHHKTAERYGYNVDGVRDFTEKGRAGCEVTWDYFFPESERPHWLTLLGDYDAWRMNLKPDCLTFYEGLKLYPQCPGNYDSVFRRLLRREEEAESILAAGHCAITYRDNFCREMRDSFGYETEIGGHRAYACNIYRSGSPGFGEKFAELTQVVTIEVH